MCENDFYEFDLYGNFIGIGHVSEKHDVYYQTFLGEEGIPLKNKLIGLSEKQYEEINDTTADHIFVVSIKETDKKFKEINRFSSIEDILHYFNSGKSHDFDYGDCDWIDRCDVAKSIRNNSTFFRDNMIVSRLSKFPKNHRKNKLKFNIIEDRLSGIKIDIHNN